jgi:hypothetical protein
MKNRNRWRVRWARWAVVGGLAMAWLWNLAPLWARRPI